MISPTNKAASLFGQHQIGRANTELHSVFAKLSSGQRINQAKDDAAGLAVAQLMLGQYRGLGMAERNAMDGGSLVQIADSYSGSINDSLQRMRELAVQAGNGTLGDSERQLLNDEFAQLQQEIGTNIQSASFGDQALLSGGGSVRIQAGANAGDGLEIQLGNLASSGPEGIGGVLDNASFNILSSSSALSALDGLDQAMQRVGQTRANLGASANRLDAAISGIQSGAMAQAASYGQIMDADYARETARSTGLMLRMQAGIGIHGQAGNLNSALVRGLLGG